MKTIRRLSAVLIGFVFFVSGILKLMDPVGTSLIVEEYFKFFHLLFMRPLAYTFGVALALVETILGAALVTGVWRKVAAIATVALTGFFTVVTLILLIANPVMDCGCFGEAVHLTHLQSFVKNIVLLALWALAFLPFRSHGEPRKIKYVSFSIAAGSSLLLFLYCALTIPLVDFTDYRPGNELGSFDDFDFSSGELPLTLNFSDAGGEYVDSLALSGKVMVVSLHTPAKLPKARWQKVSSFVRDAGEHGFTTLVLANSTPDAMTELASDPLVLSHSYFSDRRTLMAMNRSNGGVVYLDDGAIVAKWSANHMPDAAVLSEIASGDRAELAMDWAGRSSLKFQGFMLYVFAVMLLL